MKTKEQVTEEIAKLKEMKSKVRHFTMFNDDNHASIDAQIVVLEDNMNEDDIYDKWEDKKDYDKNRYLIDSAVAAFNWVNDEEDSDAPSQDWVHLVKV